MPIIDIQRRVHEAGRIRTGQQVPAGKDTRPAKLETFRLTSSNKALIEQAAALYGGNVNPWQAPAGPQWEVITGTSVLPVRVPPSDLALTQWYELWGASGCQRRCDTDTDTISDGPCLCDPDKRECKPHTRLSVMLDDLPVGLWRLETQSWNALHELQGVVYIIEMAARRGEAIPATLSLDQRVTKRPERHPRRSPSLALTPNHHGAIGSPGTYRTAPPPPRPS